MLDFDLTPVQFRLRGAVFHLDPLTLDDARAMSEWEGASRAEQIVAMQDLLARKARSRTPMWWLRFTRRTTPAAAVRSLTPIHQAKLFGEWISEYRGVGLGESSGSENS